MSAFNELAVKETGARLKDNARRDRPWQVVVWNDPVTLMSYVVFVFRRLFGFDLATATRLMLQVHNEGKAVVATEPRERAEVAVAQLHAHGLQATLARE
ncbi:MAG TPA: ATP-dependent Clp protease adapter ClpS [Candidatus Dormibacteraeota bacterium]|nr:ATP-dependent Clp protease adapter ClpS [Candidatus Dormibacteraeota bacterium]